MTGIPAIVRRQDGLWAALIFMIAAYLSLFNLGNAPLWHDESVIAWSAKNVLLEGVGIYDGWNGRNLLIMDGSLNTNSLSRDNLKMIGFPPWPALPSALGVYLFGANEVGVRFFHTLLGIGALIIFWLLLRLEFPQRRRLRVLAFAMFALFPQTILFFRYGRYTADAIFFTLLLFYCYRLYTGPTGRLWHLAVAALAMTLGFLNHFAIGGAFALALATWHLIYQARQTSRRQWIEMLIAAVLGGGCCLLYLLMAGVIGSDERLDFTHSPYEYPWFTRKVIQTFYNFRDIMGYNWLPLSVTLWFILFSVLSLIRLKRIPQAAFSAENVVDLSIIRLGILMILFLIFSSLLNLRMIRDIPSAESRYLVAALPFATFITAAFIERLWRFIERYWSSLAGIFSLSLLALALTSNVLSYPHIFPNHHSKERLRWITPELVAEIHRPYGGFQREVLDFLHRHARQDDTIHVSSWLDRAVLQFYLSDLLIFCCEMDREISPLSESRIRALGVPIYKGDLRPIWLVDIANKYRLSLEDYELVYTAFHYGYPTQRPELEFRTHTPLPGNDVHIYRRRY